MTQLLVVLRFYATGSFMQVIGDFMGLSKSTVWKIIHKVSAVIASLRPEFVRFPETLEEIRSSQAKFFRRAGLPGVIGCIDCKQVRIKSFGKILNIQPSNIILFKLDSNKKLIDLNK